MYIFGRVQPTTRAIAEAIPCLRGRRLTRIRRRRLVVNWGQFRDFSDCSRVLNENAGRNKYTELSLLHRAGVPVPRFGRDIPDYEYLGRRNSHTRGRDIELNGDGDFFTELIHKKGEYRVHVLGDDAPVITKKKKMREDADSLVWSHGNGWKQIRYREGGRYYAKLQEVGHDAVKALDYDFGAVDIVIDRDTERAIVLEVNSAPGLIEDRVDEYVEYFRGEE